MSSWLKTSNDLLNPAVVMPHQSIDINTFSYEQQCAYDIVINHSEQAFPKDPLLLIIIGVAGTGKSYLTNAIRNILQSSCAVTATTGEASNNIRGCTIHFLLKLPVGRKGNKDFSGQSFVRLQNNLKYIHYILIDEYSLLGQNMLGWIDRRCKQATGFTDQVFGGKAIILIGDPA